MPIDNTSEDALIKRVQSMNDRDAFDELVLRHQTKVRGFLLRLSKDLHLSEDLAQDTFVLAYRKIRTYQPISQFSSWLLKIAYNCYLQDYRSKSRRDAIFSSYSADLQIQENIKGCSDSKLDLEKAFEYLSQIEVASITLCYSFGYSHSEIATITSVPLGTIKTHIRTGKMKLIQILSNEVTTTRDE